MSNHRENALNTKEAAERKRVAGLMKNKTRHRKYCEEQAMHGEWFELMRKAWRPDEEA